MNMDSGLTILMVVLLVVMIAALVWGAWTFAASRPPARWAPTRRDRSLDILRERYARGEIDSDQYEERRRALEEEPTYSGASL